ncbi:hypothetical protein [Streptomyces violaceusniger]|uniref:hypothetical protein n=1 Tax=Streptomyces violaceusniger TaxID=68280 RepID=UPI0037FA8F23
MPAPHYDARTVTAPDGTRITVAHTPDSRLAHMTDAEFLAEVYTSTIQHHAAQHLPPQPTQDQAQPAPAPVIDLALERLKRHRPGAPFTADEIAPVLTDHGRRIGLAAGMAQVMNLLLLGRRPDDRP